MPRWLVVLTIFFPLLVQPVAATGPSVAPSAHAPTARITALSVEPAKQTTRFLIALSSPVPFKVGAKADPDRVELDFPALEWAPNIPLSGIGSGLISVFRQATSPDGGTRIVLETAVPVRVASAGSGLAAPGHPTEFELVLSSADGSPPPVARQATYVPSPPPRPVVTPQRVAAKLVVPTPSPTPTAVSLLSLPMPAPSAPNRKPATARHIVAIDPGHGGIDPGTASDDGAFEKRITLESGLALKVALEGTGRYTVVMTRDTDRFVPLPDRVKLARAANAELFISLHCDAMEGRQAHGATIYSLSETASDAVSDRLAQQENKSAAIGGVDLARQDDTTASMLIDLSMRQSLNGSNRFAELLVSQFADDHIRLQELKPHRSAGFAVLKAADMPSVLIEMGYLSDPEDAALLGSAKHQKAVGTAIAAAVDRYFR